MRVKNLRFKESTSTRSSTMLLVGTWLFVSLSHAQPPAAPQVISSLQTIDITSAAPQAMTVYSKPGYFEAPNWTHDSNSLLFDQGGKIMVVPVAGGAPSPVDIGTADHCNGSHGLSPDGKLLAITCATPDLPGARVYLVPSAGGTPRVLTRNPNSYFHSWSPDGRTILFTRPDHGSLNIMSIAVAGGDEMPLTTGSGTSDDPDFAPDGQIYFNSDRGGSMQIWRMHRDGSHPEQVTSDELVNWTPHVSPDGRSMVFVSYEKGVTGHPANKPVALRLMSMSDHSVRVLVRLIGGSGSINVPSWAPDSRRLAFVSYQVVPPAAPDWAQPGSATHTQVAPPPDFHRPSTNFDVPIGIFSGQSDIGSAVVPGAASFDAATGKYMVQSSGYNVWYTRDEFRYLWKKMSGDVSLAADISYPDPAGYDDRKAVLVIRQSLDDDAKEALVALHGGGMIHLAERAAKDVRVKDTEYRIGGRGLPAGHSPDSLVPLMAQRIGIEKRGDSFALFVSVNGEPMHQFGPPIQIHLDGPFYAGIGFCSHLPDKADTAILSNVVLENAAGKVR